MKQISTILILTTLVVISAHAQIFTSPENQWNVKLESFGITTEIFKIDGDSIVNSHEYKKFWISYDSLSSRFYQGLVREESNVVYFIPPDAAEGVLYDFNLEVGDSAKIINIFCWINQEIPIYVYAIDTVEYFGIARKRWHISDEQLNTEKWIEGIGSISGPLYSNFWTTIVCPVWDLLCFHNQDNLLYIKPGEENCYQPTVGIPDNKQEKITIGPNPAKSGNMIEIRSDNPIITIDIYKSNGKLIKRLCDIKSQNFKLRTTFLSPGLYFIRINQSETLKIIIE